MLCSSSDLFGCRQNFRCGVPKPGRRCDRELSLKKTVGIARPAVVQMPHDEQLGWGHPYQLVCTTWRQIWHRERDGDGFGQECHRKSYLRCHGYPFEGIEGEKLFHVVDGTQTGCDPIPQGS